jgi:hypothetical protein
MTVNRVQRFFCCRHRGHAPRRDPLHRHAGWLPSELRDAREPPLRAAPTVRQSPSRYAQNWSSGAVHRNSKRVCSDMCRVRRLGGTVDAFGPVSVAREYGRARSRWLGFIACPSSASRSSVASSVREGQREAGLATNFSKSRADGGHIRSTHAGHFGSGGSRDLDIALTKRMSAISSGGCNEAL